MKTTGIVNKPLGVQFEDYTACGSALEVCGILSIAQVLDQQLTRPEEEEEVSELKRTFLDALLEAFRKYVSVYSHHLISPILHNHSS
jgi:hypothetical protein